MSTNVELTLYYVTPQWVADRYGVPRQRVYRAITRGKIQAVRIQGARYDSWVIDKRTLPDTFPR